MGNKRGAGPATSVSPVYLASRKAEASENRTPSFVRRFLSRAAAEVTRADRERPDPPFTDPDEGAESEIEMIFRRTVAGLRRLPRHERPTAVRAAKDARLLALKALREKRASARTADHMLRKLRAQREPS